MENVEGASLVRTLKPNVKVCQLCLGQYISNFSTIPPISVPIPPLCFRTEILEPLFNKGDLNTREYLLKQRFLENI